MACSQHSQKIDMKIHVKESEKCLQVVWKDFPTKKIIQYLKIMDKKKQCGLGKETRDVVVRKRGENSAMWCVGDQVKAQQGSVMESCGATSFLAIQGP